MAFCKNVDIRANNFMKRVVVYILFLSAILYFSSCAKKVICPAYHSYFILDIDETKKVFSLFGADSVPKRKWNIEQEKWGIAKEISDSRKEKDMAIISMNSIYKKIEDPFEQFQREYAGADSTFVMDSSAVLAQSRGDNDFQNIDQMIYLHHFGKYLPKKGNSLDEEITEDLKQEEDEPLVSELDSEVEGSQKKKRKLWPFSKKDKKSKDEQTEEVPAGEDQ